MIHARISHPLAGARFAAPLAGARFAVPMTGQHVRRVFDEWCRSY